MTNLYSTNTFSDNASKVLLLTATQLCIIYEFIVSENELNITEIVRIGLVYKGYFEKASMLISSADDSALSFSSNGFRSTRMGFDLYDLCTTEVIHGRVL